MKIFKSVGHAEIHLTLGALEVFHIRELGLASIALAVGCSAIFSRLVEPLVLFLLAFTCLDMLIPDMSRRYSQFCLSLETKGCLANGAQNDIVVIHFIKSAALTFMIIWPPVVAAVDVFAELTFKREEVLLEAMLHRAMLS